MNIDIDIDDVMYGLDRYEKQQLVDELYDAGYVPKQISGTLLDSDEDSEWNVAVNKLKNNQWRLSKEDVETILRITNKIV